MIAEIIDIRYIPAETGIDTGLSRGRYPNAPSYIGGNGTYRTFWPSYMKVRVRSVDDGRVLTLIIESWQVRSITGERKFTRRLFERIRDATPDEIELEWHDGFWRATRESLADWFCEAL